MIVDVSGDGTDNCDGDLPFDRVRNDHVTDGVTVNGLPILDCDEAWKLEDWYGQHIIGGPSPPSSSPPTLAKIFSERSFRNS